MKSLDRELELLRVRAAAMLENNPEAVHGQALPQEMLDAMRLMEELRVYQTELEIQNQDLRAAQLQAEAAAQKYQRLFEHLPLDALIVDPQGFVVEANAVARRRFGLHQPNALMRRSVYQLFAIDSRSAIHSALSSRAPVAGVAQCRLAGGTGDDLCEVDSHILSLEPGAAHEAQRLLLLVDRSLEHQLAIRHEELRKSEERHRALFDHSKVPMLLIDPAHGDIVRSNEAAQRFYGYDDATLQTMVIGQINCMDPDAMAQAMRDSNFRHREHFIFNHRLADGSIVPVEVHSGPIDIDGRTLLFSIIHDISDRVQAQKKADAAHKLLQNLAAHVPGVIYQLVLGADGSMRCPYASQGAESLYEITPAQAAQDAACVFDRIHPDDRERVMASIAESARQLAPWICEFRMVLPRQGERWRGGVASPERMPDGSTLWHGFASDITEHKQAEQVQHAFARDFGSFLDRTSDFVYFKNHEGRMRFCSQSLADVFGYGNWRDLVGKLDRELFPSQAVQEFTVEESLVFEQGKPLLNRVNAFQDAQGKPGFVQTSRWPLFNDSGEVESVFGIGRDVTESRQAQARLQLSASVFTHAREGIVITDPLGNILDVNDAFCRITGYARGEVLGANPRILNSGRQDPDFYAAMWRSILQTGHWSGELWNRRKNGEIYAEILTISAVRDTEQQVKNYVALFTDITPMKEHQQQLEHIAHFDMLTGLPNRLLFADRLGQAMRMSQRRKHSLSVIYLDLDGFKAVNDSYGHDTGDTLLVVLAQRMKLALREGDSLARFGGDEFVAVLVDLEHPHDCVPVLQRLLLAAAEPVHLECNALPICLRLSASIGATIYPKDGADADLLMRHADQAMYLAKQAGKNRYHLFDVAHDSAIKSHRESLELVARALERREFVLHYQPKVDMRNGQVVGAEALIRWQHPARGLLQPSDFLPGIENHELSVQVGEWVIDTALAQMCAWSSLGIEIPVSVNVGAQQLQQPGFFDKLMAILARYPSVAHSHLELEILESSALKDIALVAQVLHSCHASAVRIALDDFGTGYSSLTYLKHLPAETLKIDQSFVRDMVSDPEDMAIVNGVIGLARAFGRNAIAEGVETAEQSELLLSLGCHFMQGYGIARPMPPEHLPDWITRWLANPIVQSA